MSDIDELYKKIEKNDNISVKDLHKYMDESWILEKKYMNTSDKEWNRIKHIQDYLNYLLQKHDTFQSGILSLIATIFLPLGVIVGFFGMNFKSMGSPALKTGVFSIKHAEKVIFTLGLISAITVIVFFYSLNYI
tara:strand:- start:963 stop:1364 length:402 start_codon:yes stop_codon:yes gene_type:complete